MEKLKKWIHLFVTRLLLKIFPYVPSKFTLLGLVCDSSEDKIAHIC